MKTKVFIILSMFAVFSVNINAQEKEKRFGFEISGGPSFATREFADGLRLGSGFDALLHYRFMPHFGVYAGWGANWLSTEISNSDQNRDYEETGYVLGLQFKHPLQGRQSLYFLRAGALYNHIEVENEAGYIMEDTGHGPGLQFSTGIEIKLGSSWSLTPVVKLNLLKRSLNSEEGMIETRFNYLTVRIGILKVF